MIKVGKPLTKEKLLKENYELEQKVAKLEIQVELLKEIMASKDLFVYKPVYQPYVWPIMPNDAPAYFYPRIPDGTETGDPLPITPNYSSCRNWG